MSDQGMADSVLEFHAHQNYYLEKSMMVLTEK